MSKIPTTKFTDIKTNWSIEIEDIETTGRHKENPNKLNLESNNKNCQYLNCTNTFMRTRKSGLCDDHMYHQHDLFLTLYNELNVKVKSPSHAEIIDNLVSWAKSRNFDLLPFFTDCSFTILGNIPDVSTLSHETTHKHFTKNLKRVPEYLYRSC